MKKSTALLIIMALLVPMMLFNLPSANASGIAHSVVATVDSYDRSSGQLNFTVDFEKSEESGIIFAVIYSSGGCIRQIKNYTLLKGSADINIIFDEPSISSNDYVKVYFFDKYMNMRPLGKNVHFSLSVATLYGTVLGTAVTGDCDPGEVMFYINDITGNPDIADQLGYSDTVYLQTDISNINDWLGIAAVVEIEEVSKGNYKINSIIQGDGSVVNLSLDQIDSDTTNETIYYYTSSSSRYSTLRLSDNVRIYYNNEYAGAGDITDYIFDWDGDVISSVEMNITVIENNGDSYYDMIMIKEYTYAVVEEVDIAKSRFTTSDGDTYVFDFEDEYVTNIIIDKNGEDITLSSFSKGDVVAIVSENWERKDFDWIEVVNLGKNVISGTVTELNEDYAYIDDTEYAVIGGALKLGDEGDFFLTLNGAIFWYNLNSEVNNYGYILNTAINNAGFEDVWQIQMLTKDGDIKIYDVRSKFVVNDMTYESDDYGVELLSDLAGESFDNYRSERIITYKLDGNGDIRTIDSVNCREFNSKNYHADAMVLGTPLEENAIVFNTDVASARYVYATDLSSLVDGAVYSGYAVYNDDDLVDCIVLTQYSEINYEPSVNEDAVGAAQYGYILNTAINNAGFEDVWQIKMLTASGDVAVYDVNSTFSVDNTSGVDSDDEQAPLLSELVDGSFDTFVDKRIVRYKLTSSGKIAVISSLANISVISNEAYRAETSTLKETLAENTIVFDITADYDSDVYADNIYCLTDGNEYSGFVAGFDDVYSCAVITEGECEHELPTVEYTEPAYAYILDTAINYAGFEDVWQIKMMTEDGKVNVYSVGNQFVVDGATYRGDDADVPVLCDLEEFYFDEKADCRIVTYRLDNTGCIREVSSLNSEFFEHCVYEAKSQTLGSNLLEDDTVVFNLDVSAADRASKEDIGFFIDNSVYSGYTIQNSDGLYDCVLIMEGGMKIDVKQDIAIVESINTVKTSDDEDAWKIKYYVSGDDEIKEIIAVDDYDVTSVEWAVPGFELSDMYKGTLFMFTEGSNGIARAIGIIATANNSTSGSDEPYYVNEMAVSAISEADTDNEFMFGYLVDWRSANGRVVIETNDGRYIAIKDTTNSYTYWNRSSSNSKISIEVGQWDVGDVDKMYDDYYGETYANFFIARIYNSAVNDFVTYSTRKVVSQVEVNDGDIAG